MLPSDNNVEVEGFEPPLYYSPPACRAGALTQAELYFRWARLQGWCSHDPRFIPTLHFGYLT